MNGRILVVDDERSIRDILAQVLGYEGYEVATASSGGEALSSYRTRAADLVILDVKMQGIDGLDTLAQLRQQDPEARVVMISGHATIATAVQAVKQGAFDFLEKPLDADRLLVTVQRAMEHRQLVGENARLREGLARATDARFAMVGASEGLGRIRELAARVAPTNARVLITGENGSGKELVARAIHDGSARAKGPFVEVNCAAIPSELVESELFGHTKGAFTGAVGEQRGKFEAANGGTLFLDEIGDLALSAQAKILRALQEGVIVRVGDSKAIPVDVRVIAATNRDLDGEIREGRFREDLYHRLNVMPIQVPPLRQRTEDIPALVSHFVAVLGGGPGMAPKPFTGGALRRLQRRRWPGNVRELRNAVERLLILATGAEVTEDDIDLVLPVESAIDPTRLAAEAADKSFGEFRDAAERAFLEARLQEHYWNVAETARALGMPRSNLYTKIEKYGLQRERQ
ncbi:MAG: sigma-54-dependent Fis family transcriptional regulator [Gemmatimonadetes bacterium]|nr:sigma-54-dependent Fis family transcriptional regulator [Gemmatimonadota bacterium]MBL0180289.1 sigma-54-dependent Fis family transcriptional regulator [Gemmatimonadota bacterium]